MDAVILAAGRNDRLKGFVPEFMKPLITVNGKPLIVDIMEGVLPMTNSVVVVVSPQNAGIIIPLLHSVFEGTRGIYYVVQPEATGPIGALNCAMGLIRDEAVMVVCADNIVPSDTWQKVKRCSLDNDVCVTVKAVPRDEAQRFTYFITKDNETTVYEKEPVPNGWPVVTCWVGPLVLPKSFINAFIEDASSLSDLIRRAEAPHMVLGDCSDIGVPEVLP